MIPLKRGKGYISPYRPGPTHLQVQMGQNRLKPNSNPNPALSCKTPARWKESENQNSSIQPNTKKKKENEGRKEGMDVFDEKLENDATEAAPNGENRESESKKKMNKKKKLKMKKKLEKEAEKANMRGVCYLSRIPPHMDHVKLRQILSQFGDIQRIFLAPQGHTHSLFTFTQQFLFTFKEISLS